MGATFRLIAFITTFASYAISLSFHQIVKHGLPTNQRPDDLKVLQQTTSEMNRRSCLSSIFNGCVFFLTVGSSRAAYAAEEESNLPCTTACMYKCEAKAMDKKGRSTGRDASMQECKEQCIRTSFAAATTSTEGDGVTCNEIPPQRKQEPQLEQSKRIEGLYPRWQDDF